MRSRAAPAAAPNMEQVFLCIVCKLRVHSMAAVEGGGLLEAMQLAIAYNRSHQDT